MSSVEVLISAMNQKDFDLFEQTNLETDALMVNQCGYDKTEQKMTQSGKWRMIYSSTKGLSCSRNVALENAKGEIVLICDDDEMLYKGYEDKIVKAYKNIPKADIICFQVERKGKKYKSKRFKVNYITSLRISSWQITMRTKAVQQKKIKFDENFGSGTPVGAGEENIFLFECLKAGLKIYYEPVCIGKVAQEKSNWFYGFTEEYFVNKGIIIKRLMGFIAGSLYSLYFAVSKYPKYKKNLTFCEAMKFLLIGLRKK